MALRISCIRIAARTGRCPVHWILKDTLHLCVATPLARCELRAFAFHLCADLFWVSRYTPGESVCAASDLTF
jgi:hypothetical protein